MRKYFILFLLSTFVGSCTKISNDPAGSFLSGSGVFILNEGNFRGGNGSLSFYSYDSLKIFNNLFLNINGRPLGDVPNAIQIKGDLAYIVINNSGKIEVINKNTLESEATIDSLFSPRNICFISDSKAYVSSMYSDYVAIINLKDNSISGHVNLRRSSESIAVSGNRAFISNWIGGKEIMVVDTYSNKVVDSIQVGIEPESMIIDKNKKLWVLCNGGWTRENFAEIVVINTVTNQIEKEFIFPDKQASPSCLTIDGNGETLYFIENGIHKMDISSSALPSSPFIPQSDHYFYKMGINPVNSDIFITDAVDYQQQGYLMIYKKDGELVSEHRTDIIPGNICFRLSDNFRVE